MNINYQKSAARKGFDPVQQTRENVNQILNRSKQEAKFTEQVAKSDLAERQRQQDAVNEAYKIEQEQEKRDYEILLDNLQREEQSRQAAAQKQAEAQQKMFSSLSTLSANAAKAYQDYSKKQEKYQIEADLNAYRTDPEYRRRVQEASRKWRTEQTVQSGNVLRGMALASVTGEDEYEIARFGQAAIPLTIGQQMGVIEDKARGYGMFLQTGTVNINGQDVSAAEAKLDPKLYTEWISKARTQFLDNQGLSGYSMQALSPVLDNMMASENNAVNLSAREFTKRQQAETLFKAEDLLNQFDTSTSKKQTQSLVDQFINQYVAGGSTQKAAVDKIFELIVTAEEGGNLLSGQQREWLLDSNDGRPGTTFRSNDLKMSEARRNLLRSQREADRNYRQEQRNRVDDFVRNSLEGELGERLRQARDRGDATEVDAIVSEIRRSAEDISPGYALSSPILNQLETFSTGADQADREEVDRKVQAGELLDRAEIISTIEDEEVRKYAFEQLERQKEERYGPDYIRMMEDVQAEAKRLTQSSANATSGSGRDRNPFQGEIERDMKAQIELQFQTALKNNKGDRSAASREVRKWWKENVTDSAVNDTSARYYAQRNGKNGITGFPNIPGGVVGSGARSVAEARQNLAPGAGRTIEGVLDTPQSLFTQSQLRDTVARYNAQDGSYFVPPTARAAQLQAERNGKKVSIEEIINRQVDAVNREQSAFDPNYEPIPQLVVPAAARSMDNVRRETREILNNTSTLSPARALRASADPALRGNEVLQTSVRNGMKPFYITGGATNGGWSEHTDIKQMDTPGTPEDEWGTRYSEDALDDYVSFTDPEFGEITLSELRRRIPIPGGNFGDPRPYGGHAGLDFGTKAGTELFLKNGARKLYDEEVPGNGTRTVIELPDGRRFGFLHGKGVR
jgi:hypothetical protein